MRFNFSQKGRQPADTRYAYVKPGFADAQWDLFTTLLSGSLTASPAGYQTGDLLHLRKEVRSNEVAFIARLAIYFAEETNFRELAFLLTAELAAITGNEEKIGQLVERIVRTPMDIPLWLDHYSRAAKPGHKPRSAVRKHLTQLFNKLDEYQYSRGSREARLALRDALRRLHPKAKDREKKQLFAAILKDHIPVRTTWEQEWHALYQQHYDNMEQRQAALRDKWKEGISSFRIGYTPLLDNVKSMLCAGVSGKVLKLAAEYLGNAAAVRRSGTHPLRLLEVYRSLKHVDQGGVGMLTEALEKAVGCSSWAGLDFGSNGTSLIAMDVSNSMKRPVNGTVGAQRFDVAPLLAILWKNRGDRLVTGIIGNTWKPFEFPDRPTLMTVDAFRSHEGEAGYAINAWLILQDLLRKKQVIDNVLIFTDCRLWGNRTFNQTAGTDLSAWWRLYKEQVAPNARLYLFDLAGYGSGLLEEPEEGVTLVNGWNEKIFDVLNVLDRDKDIILEK